MREMLKEHKIDLNGKTAIISGSATLQFMPQKKQVNMALKLLQCQIHPAVFMIKTA